jgi:2-keto-4-pentenoate hydratase
MNQAQEQASQYLVNARRTGTAVARMPEAMRPADIDTALAIQSRVGELLGATIGGWKCSAPNGDRIVVAPIWSSDIHTGFRCPALSGSIEPEIAFVLGRDLPPRTEPYTEDDVKAAIGEARMVLELIGSRFAQPKEAGFLEKLADSASNQGLFLGPAIPGGITPEMGHFPISVESRGKTIFEVEGKHPDGHPLIPLFWLANFLSRSAQGLKAGQVVTTGSYCGVIEVPLGDPLRIVFGAIGAMDVQLATY